MSWRTGSKRPARPLNVVIDGISYRGWVSQIFKQYIARADFEGRHLEVGWEDYVWRALKDVYPGYIIETKKGPSPPVVNLASIKSFLKLVRRRGLNRQVVSEEEALRRAAICSDCPLAGPISGCGTCKQLVKSILKIPRGNLVPKDKAGCTVCGCYVDAKVWIKREHLDSEIEKYTWPDHCWVKLEA